MKAIRVLVADDDGDMRAALDDVLSADHRFHVVGLAANGAETVRVAEESGPDLVLLDVRMPDGGVVAARALVDLPRPPVVVAISADTETGTVMSMLRAGVTGYLGKGRLGRDLPDLVARCADGQVVLALPNGASVLRSMLTLGVETT